MSKFLYILLDIGSVIVPFIFSFHPKLRFNKKWKSTLLATSIVALVFIIWDVYYTGISVWGFNPDYLLGFNVLGLPIEEILFFFCIPYACIYTYHCLKILIPSFNFRPVKIIGLGIILMLFIVGIIYYDKMYTSVTFISLSIAIFYIQFIQKPVWIPRLYLSLLILILPFLLINGILTGTGIESEVVWYNQDEIMGFRLLTVPFEDFAYGFLLILLNVYIFEKFDFINNKLNLTS
jgi:lycopene cyclase domain-containing protein